MGVVDEIAGAFAGFAAQARENGRRRRRMAVKIPYHPLLGILFVALAVLAAACAVGLAAATYFMLTDELMLFLGAILMPITISGMFVALQYVVWTINYVRRGAAS